MEKNILPIKKAVLIFFVFACGYFISALLRAITATLSPLLTSEFNLNAGDLGLLAGGYFLGFASMQIPLGYLLDKHGPKKVVSSFLLIAIIGTTAFALAQSFSGLLISRILIGVGVSACLMGPLTGYRIWFADEYQQRANAWMLMVLSMGFVFSTLPVQILLPTIGWRWIFGSVAIIILLIIILTLLSVSEASVTQIEQLIELGGLTSSIQEAKSIDSTSDNEITTPENTADKDEIDPRIFLGDDFGFSGEENFDGKQKNNIHITFSSICSHSKCNSQLPFDNKS